jgi:DNA-binding NtrC family response regulator
MATVLAVDDERSIRQLLGRRLSDAGYSYSGAENADAALVAMEAQPADVVFRDVQMPGRDGLWLTRELRRRYPTSAAVLATGLATVPPSISMQSGVLAYLVKPFRRETVLDALRRALAWHEEAAAGRSELCDVQELDMWLDSLEKD